MSDLPLRLALLQPDGLELAQSLYDACKEEWLRRGVECGYVRDLLSNAEQGATVAPRTTLAEEEESVQAAPVTAAEEGEIRSDHVAPVTPEQEEAREREKQRLPKKYYDLDSDDENESEEELRSSKTTLQVPPPTVVRSEEVKSDHVAPDRLTFEEALASMENETTTSGEEERAPSATDVWGVEEEERRALSTATAREKTAFQERALWRRDDGGNRRRMGDPEVRRQFDGYKFFGTRVLLNETVNGGRDDRADDEVTCARQSTGDGTDYAVVFGKTSLFFYTGVYANKAPRRVRHVLVATKAAVSASDVRGDLRQMLRTQHRFRSSSYYFEVSECKPLTCYSAWVEKLYGTYTVENEAALGLLLSTLLKSVEECSTVPT